MIDTDHREGYERRNIFVSLAHPVELARHC